MLTPGALYLIQDYFISSSFPYKNHYICRYRFSLAPQTRHIFLVLSSAQADSGFPRMMSTKGYSLHLTDTQLKEISPINPADLPMYMTDPWHPTKEFTEILK